MKVVLEHLLSQALAQFKGQQGFERILSEQWDELVGKQLRVSASKHISQGDYACSIAMSLAKLLRQNPFNIAQQIVENIPANASVNRVEVARPGYINFYLTNTAPFATVAKILEQRSQYGRTELEFPCKVQLEFVSANPTGPLHVGHGRHAAYGSTLANIMREAGYEIEREYYINDAGRQMHVLTLSTWLRYLEAYDIDITYPLKAYQGNYVIEMAKRLKHQYKDKFNISPEVAPEASSDPDLQDKLLDKWISCAQQTLSDDNYNFIFKFVSAEQIESLKNDLADFNVEYDSWMSELSLVKSERMQTSIQKLIDSGLVYEKDGALWFQSTKYGDEKDRVVRRKDGQYTYFSSDIAYLESKMSRGYDRCIYIVGADHHGYIGRIKAACAALGYDTARVEFKLVQFANLIRDGEPVAMTTRGGVYITLRELYEEVGKDAARFLYLQQKIAQHLDFDLELAKRQQKDNPVYYVQYGYARICSLLEKAKSKGKNINGIPQPDHFANIASESSRFLAKELELYPEVIQNAANELEPQKLVQYMRHLVSQFHSWYDKERIIADEDEIAFARLSIARAIQQVLKNGFIILQVSAPENM